MCERLIVEGLFGIDDNLDNYINGSLHVNENGFLTLTLLNSFSDDLPGTFAEIQNLVEKPLIKGFGRDGKYYELINCVSGGGNLKLGGVVQPKVYYNCEYVIEYPDQTFREKDFNKFSFTIDKLNQWSNEEACWKLKSYQPPYSLDIIYKTFWEKEKNGSVYSISNGFKTNAEENINFYIDFDYCFGITFESQPITVDLIREYQSKVWDFMTVLTLMINDRVTINKLSIITPDKQHSAKIYCSLFEEKTDKKIETYKKLGMIALRDVSDSLLDIVEKYISKKELLLGTINTIYKNAKHTKHRKIDVMDYLKQTATAIEGFMRNSRNILIEEDQEKFNEKIERILENQTEEDKQWLSQKLKYSNQASFRKQITKLFDELKTKYPEHGQGFLDKKKIREDIIDRLVSTRNFYTHYDVESKGKMLGTNTQVYLCDFINEMLRLLILEDLGVGLEVLRKKNNVNQNLIIANKNLLKSYVEENNG